MRFVFWPSAVVLFSIGILLLIPERISESPVPPATTDTLADSNNEFFSSTHIDGIAVMDSIQIVEYIIPEKPLVVTRDNVIPFTSQAPFGNWDDPRQQDGCEEASVLMAMKWINGNPLTPEEALAEIHDMAAYQLKNYGSYMDTSAADTAERLLNNYYGHEYYAVIPDVTVENLIEAIMSGAVVLAPMNGRALKNPNFTAPGPEYHMLLIKGYDAATDEFITNDPGTRKGANYRYSSDVLFEAIRDYPTGDHLPIAGTEKTVILVRKQAVPF